MRILFFALVILTASIFALDPSPNPPGGLKPSQVPQFIFIGSDDQSVSPTELASLFSEFTNPAGIQLTQNYDNTQAHLSFYSNSVYRNLTDHIEVYQQGHEIGNHTHDHLQMDEYKKNIASIEEAEEYFLAPIPAHYEYFYTPEQATINGETTTVLTPDSTWIPEKAGISKDKFSGFRIPFLHTTNAAFDAIDDKGYLYDCSLEDGFQNHKTATNMNWPYTLENPDQEVWQFVLNTQRDSLPLQPHPGLWEIPVHPFLIPEGTIGTAYNLAIDFRHKTILQQKCFSDTTCTTPPALPYNKDADTTAVKITGFDYNLYNLYKLSNAQVLAILKYNLDQRYNSNRAPFAYGIHAKNYSGNHNVDNMQMLRDFLRYAVTLPDVRIVTGQEIIKWMKKPISIDGKVTHIKSITELAPFSLSDGILSFKASYQGEAFILNSKGQILEHHLGANRPLNIVLPKGHSYLKIKSAQKVQIWKL